MKKFNEFELWFLTNAIHEYVAQAEANVEAAENNGRCLFAPGYFTMVGKEMIEKIDSMTKKQKKNA